LEEIDRIIKEEQVIDKRHTRNDKTMSQFEQSKAQMENKLKDPKKTFKEENL